MVGVKFKVDEVRRRLPASVRCLIAFSLYSQRACQLNQGVTLAPTAFALYLQGE